MEASNDQRNRNKPKRGGGQYFVVQDQTISVIEFA